MQNTNQLSSNRDPQDPSDDLLNQNPETSNQLALDPWISMRDPPDVSLWQATDTSDMCSAMTRDFAGNFCPDLFLAGNQNDQLDNFFSAPQPTMISSYGSLGDEFLPFPANNSSQLEVLPSFCENSLMSSSLIPQGPEYWNTLAPLAAEAHDAQPDTTLMLPDNIVHPQWASYVQPQPAPSYMMQNNSYSILQHSEPYHEPSYNDAIRPFGLLPDLTSRATMNEMPSSTIALGSSNGGHFDAIFGDILSQELFPTRATELPYAFIPSAEFTSGPSFMALESPFLEERPHSDEHAAAPMPPQNSETTRFEGLQHSDTDIASKVKNSRPIDASSKPFFGPTRPISLPPARRGGRKGPLTAEAKVLRKEARQKGACIRCRRFGKPCRGGFPCQACLQKSSATFWKFPCTKATFFDMIEGGPYFETIFSFHSKGINQLDENTIIEQLHKILCISKEERYREFSTVLPYKEDAREISPKLPYLISTNGIVHWELAVQTMVEILKIGDDSCKGQSILHRMSVVAQRHAKRKNFLPPIIFSMPPFLGGCSETWSAKQFMFCQFTWKYMDESNGILQELGIEGNFKETLDILVWISRRQFELSLFQRLQNSANQVFSLSERELFDTANLLLQVLTFGLADDLGTSNIRLDSQNDSNPSRRMDYLEQKGRIRSALFCYLQITISQLGSWNYFFDRIACGPRFLLQKVLKGELDLNTFEENTKDQLQDTLDSLDQCQKWCETFYLPQGVTQSGLREDDLKRDRGEFNLAEMIEVIGSTLREPPYRRDVEAIVHALTEHYRPCFDGIVNVYENAFENGGVPEILPLIRAEIETLENFQKCLPQAMKDFKDFPNNEGKDEVYRGFMSMVAEALNRMVQWNKVLKIFFDAGILSRDGASPFETEPEG